MDKCEDCSGLEELRKEYGKIKEKYELPEFSDLNKLFDVEDIEVDTEFLLRKFRRVISERIAGYLRFIEIILNPSNAPMFFFKMIKKLEEEDRKNLSEVYDVLGKFELDLLSLDIDYFEVREAEFIKNVYEVFENDVKVKLLVVVDRMGNDSEGVKKDGNGYVG